LTDESWPDRGGDGKFTSNRGSNRGANRGRDRGAPWSTAEPENWHLKVFEKKPWVKTCATCGEVNPFYDHTARKPGLEPHEHAHKHDYDVDTAECVNCGEKSDTACDTCGEPLGSIATAKNLKGCPSCGTKGNWRPLTERAKEAAWR